MPRTFNYALMLTIQVRVQSRITKDFAITDCGLQIVNSHYVSLLVRFCYQYYLEATPTALQAQIDST